MKIKLPDNSIVYLDKSTFQFHLKKDCHLMDFELPLNFELLQQFLEEPKLKFGECFRRVNNTPKYSPIGTKHDVNVQILDAIYKLKLGEGGYGMMFTSSLTHYLVLDGRISIYRGYGWGHKSWMAIEGYEALRATCMFQDIKQPKRIKGEPNGKNLAEILVSLSQYELNHNLYLRRYNEFKELKNSLN